MYTPSDRIKQQIDNAFTFHPLLAVLGQAERYQVIRDAAKSFAEFLSVNCPESRELSLALTKLEECNLFANAAIARNEKADDTPSPAP